MPHCYYTCNLLPLDLLVRSGYTPRWLGNHLRGADVRAHRDALSVHSMTCPFVTKLVAAAERVFADANNADTAGVAGGASPADCLVVPGGCDAMRRLGDLLDAAFPGRVFTLAMPRSSGDAVVETVAGDLRRLEGWLTSRLEGHLPTSSAAAEVPPGAPEPPTLDYPEPPRPGGVFVVAGPLSDDSLLDLIHRLGTHVSGLESCTSPDRWRPLLTAGAPLHTGGDEHAGSSALRRTLAADILATGMCPRRSTVDRLAHLARRLDEARPSSVIYARQSFCDPGAYDALLVARLAGERGLPYLEIEVDFPFDANGPLRTRVEAFLEAQLLDDDLLDLFSEED